MVHLKYVFLTAAVLFHSRLTESTAVDTKDTVLALENTSPQLYDGAPQVQTEQKIDVMKEGGNGLDKVRKRRRNKIGKIKKDKMDRIQKRLARRKGKMNQHGRKKARKGNGRRQKNRKKRNARGKGRGNRKTRGRKNKRGMKPKTKIRVRNRKTQGRKRKADVKPKTGGVEIYDTKAQVKPKTGGVGTDDTKPQVKPTTRGGETDDKKADVKPEIQVEKRTEMQQSPYAGDTQGQAEDALLHSGSEPRSIVSSFCVLLLATYFLY